MDGNGSETYTTLKIQQSPQPNSRVFHVIINNPSRRNALSLTFFSELPIALSSLDLNPDVSVIVLSGSAQHFCSGIDLQALHSLLSETQSQDSGRSREKLRRRIKFLQRAVTAIEECRKPVIAAIDGSCIGGGVDIITACDVRWCTEQALFSVKEVDLAITADLGSLQRLPGIVGFGNAMELALTGRVFSGNEAKELGLVTRVFGSWAVLDKGVAELAEGIAAKSPLAVIGTKRVLLEGRNMSVDQGLDYVATWNSGVLISDDLTEAISALQQKRRPLYSKL